MGTPSIFAAGAKNYLSSDLPFNFHNLLPEQHLALNVLSRAVVDASGNCGLYPKTKQQYLMREAEVWLFVEPEEPYAFCFSWICEALDVEPRTLRRRIKKLLEQGRVNTRHTMPQADRCAG